MRYITIPSPIGLKKPNSDEPLPGKDGGPAPSIPFDAFIFNHFLTRPGFAVGYKGAKAVEHIEDVILPAKAGDVVSVDEEVWKKLADEIENRLTIEPAWIHRQYIPFMEAVLRAPDKKPKE